MAPPLSVRGYNPVCVHTGQAALRVIETSPPSFIILDINLPDMTGFDVLRAIRASPRTANVLVFMLTGRTDVGSELRSFDLGATEFFHKPVNPRDMIEQIHEVLLVKGSEVYLSEL
jgi:DNA-binding response OmpR family regulator